MGRHGNDYLVKCACSCGVLATFLVTEERPNPPISLEDVWVAHVFLKDYIGGWEGLFTKALPPPEGKDGV